jgi:hypothetical protein
MSKQTIGPRELALRAQREAAVRPTTKASVRELVKALPVTSGRKPIKRKAKKPNPRRLRSNP